MKKICQNCKIEFEITENDLNFYEKIKVSTPNFCHECRMQRKLSWRNERTLYKRECSLCNKSIISVFHKDKIFPVYCYSCYHGTNWDPIKYGMEIDFSKPFLQQFHELQKKVPRQYALVFNNINSDYVNTAGFNKNCYLCFVSDHNEDCSYSYNTYYSKNSADLINCHNCELSYESINCINCQKVIHSMDCKDSFNLFFSKDCSGCNDLICCVGLRKKSYCIFNKQHTKEEYEKIKKDLNLNSFLSINKLEKEYLKLLKDYPVKYLHGVNNYKVTGDNVNNSKNAICVFSARDLENCKYIINGNKSKDCYECYVAVGKSELCFDSMGCYATNNTIASHLPWSSYNLNYCDGCENSSNLFGCVSLKNKQYCILNKQYDKEEYEKLKEKIIKQMKEMPYIDKNGIKYFFGDFFPSELSPYSYNETIANFYYPLTKEEITKKNYNWQEKEKRNYNITLLSKEIPDKINEIKDSIIDEVIECSNNGNLPDCTEAFKITKSEFDLYKNLNLPLPRYCHNCRHNKRLKLENPRKLWHRKCMKEGCKNEFETSYSPDRPEIVYCESCYNKEIY